jgi:UDP-glucuronate 4-epimerase
MKILITGAAGFIGFNLCKYLLEKTNFNILGIDNLNDYYDVSLKKKRLKYLNSYKKFKFKKIDITRSFSLEKIFKKYKFDFVYNLAAQAGVRYSINHPRKYIDANILGFFNIIDYCKKYNVKRLFYASSSSVYGESKKFPLKETENITPKNIYGLSKKINEEISFIYNQFYNLKLTGLRFFTVYGEWGRPDMMMLKFIDSYFKKKIFRLHNFGRHTRDFTHIDDVVEILYKLLLRNNKLKNNDILNICSNKPINLTKIISFMMQNGVKPKISKVKLQKADILKTHGDNKKLFKYIGFKKFNNWRVSVKNLITWYKKNML